MDNNADHREEDKAPAGDDQDTGAPVTPVIRLQEVIVSTGEEEEQPLLDFKAKLYRFDRDGSKWKERGVGSVKLLKHDVTGKVRLLMRQSKTLKICANHLIGRGMSVQQHAGNEKSCVWNATDFAGDELKDELFCIRFASIENCRMFLDSFQEIVKSQNQEGKSNNEENQENEKNKNNGENQSHEENQNNGENQNHEENHNIGENKNHEESQNNGENKNHEENQNNGENQDKANKDASATARLLKNLNVEEHATST